MTTLPHSLPRAATVLCALALATLTAGCQQRGRIERPDDTPAEAARRQCEGDLGPSGNTVLATIEQQIADGRSYAALAQLDALKADTNKARWLRAEALRRIDHNAEALALYGSLRNTCMDGRALHGLGLIAARNGQLSEAIGQLRRAREQLPLDTRIRNDLGYALLLDRQWEPARFEFLTALDLSPKDPLAARNLVLLAHLQGKPDLARTLVTRFGLDDATAERLADQAASMLLGTVPAKLAPSPAPPAPPVNFPPP